MILLPPLVSKRTRKALSMLPPELPLLPGVCVAVGAGVVGFVVTVAVGTGVETVLKRAVISTSSAGMVYAVSLLSGFSKVPLPVTVRLYPRAITSALPEEL